MTTQDIGNSIRITNSLYLEFCRLPNAKQILDPDDNLQDDDYDYEEIEATRKEMKYQAERQVNPEANIQAISPTAATGSSDKSQEELLVSNE